MDLSWNPNGKTTKPILFITAKLLLQIQLISLTSTNWLGCTNTLFISSNWKEAMTPWFSQHQLTRKHQLPNLSTTTKRRLRPPGFSQVQLTRKHQLPDLSATTERRLRPPDLASTDWLGSYNSPLFTSFDWKEATTSCRQLACPCTTQPPFILSIEFGSLNLYELLSLPSLSL